MPLDKTTSVRRLAVKEVPDGSDAVHAAIHAPTARQRLKIGMDALLAHRAKGLVHYTQSSKRMTIVRLHLVPPFGTRVIWEDCSSIATGLYRMAGLHDPNNLKFSGFGFTGTLCEHGRRIRSWEVPQVGDLVFYGQGKPWHHVAVLYSRGKVFSHGSEGGPIIRDLDYRSDRGEIRRYIPWKGA